MLIYAVASHYFLKALEKLKRQLADADAAVAARKKPPEDTGPRIIGEGLVIDEWVCYLKALTLHLKTISHTILHPRPSIPFCAERAKRKVPCATAS